MEVAVDARQVSFDAHLARHVVRVAADSVDADRHFVLWPIAEEDARVLVEGGRAAAVRTNPGPLGPCPFESHSLPVGGPHRSRSIPLRDRVGPPPVEMLGP